MICDDVAAVVGSETFVPLSGTFGGKAVGILPGRSVTLPWVRVRTQRLSRRASWTRSPTRVVVDGLGEERPFRVDEAERR